MRMVPLRALSQVASCPSFPHLPSNGGQVSVKAGQNISSAESEYPDGYSRLENRANIDPKPWVEHPLGDRLNFARPFVPRKGVLADLFTSSPRAGTGG